MTLEDFQSFVLYLGSRWFVRHHVWLNYPYKPHLMGLQFTRNPNGARGAAVSCTCGKCKLCQRRAYMQRYRPTIKEDTARLMEDLTARGFTKQPDSIWVITMDEN
jgi:hypothetical protein